MRYAHRPRSQRVTEGGPPPWAAFLQARKGPCHWTGNELETICRLDTRLHRQAGSPAAGYRRSRTGDVLPGGAAAIFDHGNGTNKGKEQKCATTTQPDNSRPGCSSRSASMVACQSGSELHHPPHEPKSHQCHQISDPTSQFQREPLSTLPLPNWLCLASSYLTGTADEGDDGPPKNRSSNRYATQVVV